MTNKSYKEQSYERDVLGFKRLLAFLITLSCVLWYVSWLSQVNIISEKDWWWGTTLFTWILAAASTTGSVIFAGLFCVMQKPIVGEN